MSINTTIQLQAGPVTALTEDNLIHARGIPYAKAIRFEALQPAEQWTEAHNCTERVPICPQLASRLESVMGPLTKGQSLSEDCLHLSITAPKGATTHLLWSGSMAVLISQVAGNLTATSQLT